MNIQSTPSMYHWKPILLSLACATMLVACKSDDTQTGQEVPLYTELHRPQIHFSPPQKWMNDPNGLVYLDGEYHMFYQHYPDSLVWGPMHWGHAITRDLVHWENLPIALEPDSLGYIFSGGAVYDAHNTSGLGTDSVPPLVAIFTHHDPGGESAGRNDYQVQSIAYSTDKGRTWHKYAHNPVLNNPGIRDFRDPNVIWHEPTQQWVMALAVFDHIRFYGSPNLIDWELLGQFGEGYGTEDGVWECPDLFPLDLNGEEKWVLLVSVTRGASNGGSGTFYFVGQFDGQTFTPDPHFKPNKTGDGELRWIDYGRDNYAGVTWFNNPDDRQIFLGWMSNWDYAQVVPTNPWRCAMTLPRVLSLEETDDGARLLSQPVEELHTLRNKSFSVMSINLQGEWSLSDRMDFPVAPVEIELEFAKRAGTEVTIVLRNDSSDVYKIGYDADSDIFFSDRTAAGTNAFAENFAQRLHTAPRSSADDIVRMHVFIDVASAELFADGGSTVMTEIFFAQVPFDQLALSVEGAKLEIRRAVVYMLKPVWNVGQGDSGAR